MVLGQIRNALNKGGAKPPANNPPANNNQPAKFYDEKNDKKEKKIKEEKIDPPPRASPDAPTEEITLSATATKGENDVTVKVTAQPGPGSQRTPLDICCVVDVSGSMMSSASIKTADGKEEGHGLSVLDVVKHAVKTVIHSLQPYDRVALVAFESRAVATFSLTHATDDNKEAMVKKLETLHPSGGTNLWAGLETGMDLLRDKSDRATRFPALLVLTDGMPDFNPAENLRKYMDTNKQLPVINTFGFGYSVETPMLLNIAKEGNGMHCFIPDASFVGTAFVNSITNLMVTVASNVTVSVEPENGATIVSAQGKHQNLSWGTQIDLGSMQYSQSKSAILTMSVPPGADPKKPFARVTLRYERATHPANKSSEEKEVECASTDTGGVALQVETLRLSVVDTITELLQLASTDNKAAQDKLDLAIENANAIDDPHAKGMSQDLSGQVREALQRVPEDFYTKWGQHYLPSLARAHLLQQCNNFKDPGIQFYGGDLFKTLRDHVEEIFVKLPPPKPSIAPRNYGGIGGGKAAAPLASMATYYNASGGCMAGECMVHMADGSKKRVDQVVKGDKVVANSLDANLVSEVVCVVETVCYGGKESLVKLPCGLRITPYHPVFAVDSWKFPVNLAAAERDATCKSVYNFVLSGSRHAMVIEGMDCVTLGHGMEGEVVGHAYFGTQKVIEDLKSMKGWESGKVTMRPELCGGKSMVRDEKTSMVCGYARGVDGNVSSAVPAN